MKFKTITYSESVESVNEYGLKRWRKYEAEVELDEGDSEVVAKDIVRNKVQSWLNNTDNMVDDYIRMISNSSIQQPSTAIKYPPISQPVGVGEEAINSCNSLKALEIYLPLIDKVKDLEERKKLFIIYDNKFAELSNTGK